MRSLMMHATSAGLRQSRPLFCSAGTQHFVPPGRFEHPTPPQLPHVAGQQAIPARTPSTQIGGGSDDNFMYARCRSRTYQMDSGSNKTVSYGLVVVKKERKKEKKVKKVNFQSWMHACLRQLKDKDSEWCKVEERLRTTKI